jgi:hypothetical protein
MTTRKKKKTYLRHLAQPLELLLLLRPHCLLKQQELRQRL